MPRGWLWGFLLGRGLRARKLVLPQQVSAGPALPGWLERMRLQERPCRLSLTDEAFGDE
ncbi:MAG: hypothetical protein RMN25_12225 [Anaerolineae bacterium]|nr:hypothetical protein [Thermoflexales bacterium]MDW8408536.1 hypothetical protein [Anaerolineae bacterium]